jgi:hypothetical protein
VHRRGSRSSKYKPLVTRKRIHKVREQKLPNINPSVRVIWRFMADGRIIYQKDDVIANIEEDCLDMETTLPELVQELDFTFEDVIRFMHFLPSLLSMCKAHHIDVINIPIMPRLEDYKKWKEDEDF